MLPFYLLRSVLSDQLKDAQQWRRAGECEPEKCDVNNNGNNEHLRA
jgi:hypothetical protein